MIRRPPRSTLDRSSAASDVYKRQQLGALVENHLKLKLNDLAAWHYIVVEQDLELHGEIRSVPDSSPRLIEVNL